MNKNPIYITKADHEKLTRLIEELGPDRGKLPEHLQRLQDELDRAELTDSQKVSADVITLNSKVKITEMDSGDILELTLVSPEYAIAEEGKISVLAPLGTAMLGYRVGDTFEWLTPAGKNTARVEEILFQPEQVMQRGE